MGSRGSRTISNRGNTNLRALEYWYARMPEGSKLLSKMNALESFPSQRLPGDEDQHEHVMEFMGGEQVGTMFRDEWEALNIVTVFAFKKMR